MVNKMIKKQIIFLFIFFFAVVFFSACSTQFSIDNGIYQFISFTASPVYVKKGKTTTLTAVVENPLNDVLSYSYQIINGGGSISGNGSAVTYSVANIVTNAQVMVVVTDSEGLSLTNTVSITVMEPFQKISDTQGNFTGILDDADWFGISIANIGDLNGDGVTDIAVGARLDDDGGTDRGAVWILFLNADGSAKAHQKLSDTEGNFTGVLDDDDGFGNSVASIGDLDGDGVADIAVGAPFDDDGGAEKGAVWILFLNADGTVKSYKKISDTEGGFTGILDGSDNFGRSVASIGDLDGDGVQDIAVGAGRDDDGGTDRGAVWILFLNINGSVKGHQKISDTEGGFTGILDNSDFLGFSVASIGDLDGDGVQDIAVGAIFDDDGGDHRGAVWILFLNTDGTVKSHQKISDTDGAFTGVLDNGDYFGRSIASIGDLDKDGVQDIAVGAYYDDDGGSNRGAVWILFLNTDGTVKSHQKISDTQGNFTGTLDDSGLFGVSIANIGDLNGDGVTDIVTGAYFDDDGGTDRGAVWVLFLNPDGTVGQ